jgi:hypothetical protein
MNPLVLGLVLNPHSKTADDKYADIYLWNNGQSSIQVETRSGFSVTANEQTGDSLVHGAKSKLLTLRTGEYAWVGDIIEWELDSALWFDIYFKDGDKKWMWLGYNLGRSYSKSIVPQLNAECWVVEPEICKPKPR